jgi:phosphate-selective porin OprO/OprP
LNIDTHTVFAVHNGTLRKNSLSYDDDMFEDKHKRAGWHAYMPPPVALATHYDKGDAWNHWATKNTENHFFGVLALDRQYWISQDQASEQQVGDLDDFEGGEIRDLRLGLHGSLNYFNTPWGYNVVVATNAFDKKFEIEGQDNFRFLDYRLDIPLSDGVTLSVGKQKEPISMERLMTLIDRPMQERSSVSVAFLASRNFGALISGNMLSKRMSWAGGIFNSSVDSDESFDDDATSFVGRTTWLPYVSDNQSNLIHLGLAVKLSEGNDGYQYRADPEFNKSPEFVDTGALEADRIRQYNLDASWRRGPFWLTGEYTRTDVDTPVDGKLGYSGFFVTGSWILTGEMRSYNYKSGTFGKVPVSRSAYQNGKGAWEMAVRWSSIDLNDGPVAGGKMDVLSLGTNWWLSSIFSVSLNYRYIMNDRDDLDGTSSGANVRVLLKLQ